jgi:hypothetical protein
MLEQYEEPGAFGRVQRKNLRGQAVSDRALFSSIVRSAHWDGVRAMVRMTATAAAAAAAEAEAPPSGLATSRAAFLRACALRLSLWRDVQRSVFFQALGVACGEAYKVTVPLLHAIVLGERALGHHLAQRAGASKPCPVTAFALALHARWVGTKVKARLEGPYARIFDVWTDEEEIVRAIGELCTEHLRRAGLEGDDSVLDEGYEICPIELAALRTVRDQEGLVTPRIDHPLLSTPLAQIPPGPTGYDPESDALLVEAADLARRLAPERGSAIDDCVRSRPELEAPASIGPRGSIGDLQPAPTSFARALALLPFESSCLIDPGLDAEGFSHLALDSDSGVTLDWKLTHEGVLEELGVGGDFSFEKSWSRDRLVSAALKRLGGDKRPFRSSLLAGSDTDGYLLLDDDVAAQLRSVLGASFDALFTDVGDADP